ncbi:hypothetical protein T190611E02C_10964 [Tenacibaculum sp. 190524A05c]|uniref:pentapeptide repeat-containing protein n=1 Tax=Tenacibaculum platacis TaxID=3137852 RepID=UPI0031FA838A
MENNPDYNELVEENKNLKSQLEAIEKSRDKRKVFYKWIFRKAAGVFIGKGLKEAIKETLTEFNTKGKISSDTFSNLGAHIIWRITRIGVFGVIIALIPTLFLIIQTFYLGQQNKKIDYQNNLIINQNNRLEQQTYLQEADRRSSLVFLSSNVMDKIDIELKAEKNTTRELSDQLIGRIAALSRSLKPYKYLERDSLTVTTSPERGQLLINLINSNLSANTYKKIFNSSDFSYAEIYDAVFEEISFGNINLSNAKLENVRFRYCEFGKTDFSESILNNVRLENCSANMLDFSASIITNIGFDNFFGKYLKMDVSYIHTFQLTQSSVIYLSLYESYVNNFNFGISLVDRFQFILNDGELKEFFKFSFPEKYNIWNLIEKVTEVNDQYFYIEDVTLLDSEISENILLKNNDVFTSYFETVKVLSLKSHNIFDKYFEIDSLIRTKDSLSITYSKPEIEKLKMRNLIYLEVSNHLEEIKEDMDETDPWEIMEKKKVEFVLNNILSNTKSYKRKINSFNYDFGSGFTSSYKTFIKNKKK